MDRKGAESSRTAFERAAPLLVLAVLLAGYARTLGYPWHFDDYSNLRDNVALGPPPDLGAIWRFRPPRVVVYLSFAWNALITGRNPAGLRAGNLLIHFAVALLAGRLAALLARMTRPPRAERPGAWERPDTVGAIVALIFAAHPLATQAVTYLIQRTASLAALFIVGATVLWLRAREQGGVARWCGSAACALLAALTKETAVALPALIAMLELALPEPHDRHERTDMRAAAPWRRAARVLPYFAVWLVLLATMRMPTAHRSEGIVGFRETGDVSRTTYFLTELTVIPRYVGLFVWPHGQSLDPPVTLRAHPDAAVWAGGLMLILLTAAAVFGVRRRPLIAIGWLWFVIAILPESSLFPIRDLMVEHRTYVPLAGLALASAGLLTTRRAPPRGVALAIVAIVVALTIVTHFRNRVWRDELALWNDVVRKAPAGSRGYDNRGYALEASGRVAEAETDYHRAIALDSTDIYALTNLGQLYGKQGRYAEGLPPLLQAVRHNPSFVPARNDLAVTLQALGDTVRAQAVAAGTWPPPNATASGR